MSAFGWILASTLAMSVFAWAGLIFLALSDEILRKTLYLLVAFASGSMMGGSFLHLIPETLSEHGADLEVFLWVLAGFATFLCMEQFLNWHHTHYTKDPDRTPFTYLILVADGLHNFLGGLAIGGSFMVSPQVGLVTWVTAAAHELPQEFGDFGILVHGGWTKGQALVFNFVSALTVVPGGLLAWWLSGRIETLFLLPFAAGNFIYIAASDLIPQIKHFDRLIDNLASTVLFVLGILMILLSRQLFL